MKYKLTSKIEAKTPKLLLRELRDMTTLVRGELKSKVCKDCHNRCECPKGTCIMTMGSSEPGLESTHKLYRKVGK